MPSISVQLWTKSDALRNGPLNPKGIMVHSTVAPGVSAQSFRDQWNRSGLGKSVHFFLDDKDIIQCLDLGKKAGHCGGSGNNTLLSFEICEPSGIKYNSSGSVILSYNPPSGYFSKIWTNATWLCAYLCTKYNLNPLDDNQLMCHSEGHAKGIASNHGDVMHWFPLEGKDMNQFRQAVKSLMSGGGASLTTFTPRLSAPSWTSPYWINVNYGGMNRCIVRNSSTGLVVPNCTGWAWGRFMEIMGTQPKLSVGNAGTWYLQTSDGYQRGNTPRLGAVACWSKPGAAGHVAIVEQINSDGTITLSESGYSSSSKFWTSRQSPPNYYSSAYKFQGFIYNPAVWGDTISVDNTALREAFLSEAMSHEGEGPTWTYKTCMTIFGDAWTGYEWCAAFVSAVGYVVGATSSTFTPSRSCQGIISGSLQNFGGTWVETWPLGKNMPFTPGRGDFIFFRWNSSSDLYAAQYWADHIGIVTDVINNVVYTIEGNRGGNGPLGNHVLQKQYSVNSSSIFGYYRPNWGVGSSIYSGPLYETRNTREDATIREFAYMNNKGEPSIQSSTYKLSAINFTPLVGALYDVFIRKLGISGVSSGQYGIIDNLDATPRAIVEYLEGKGFPTAAAIGIIAHMYHESRFDTGAVGDNGTSFGICQWHVPAGRDMRAFVGPDWATNLTGQLDYFWYEMSTTFTGVRDRLMRVPNTEQGAREACAIIVQDFGAMGAASQQLISTRQDTASEFWNQIAIQTV